ncbi:recQ-mediated genome instability protein 2 [Amia ocellicauda]|uniref:recQ-mediated genome instability protein 2 n=1 Tax=Amia ocellicauda TaxID=2972642 RepID=UPI00346437E7|nr:RMI2 protein [Amia calva]
MDASRRAPGAVVQSPPVKMLSSQLREGQTSLGPTGKLVCTVKRQRCGAAAAPLEVSLVWMQGTVVEVKGDDSTTVLLLDETGTFSVTGVDHIPKGSPCLSQGKYVMVMGTVQSCTPEPVLRAVKMADLSGNPTHRKGWKLEVIDLQQTLP